MNAEEVLTNLLQIETLGLILYSVYGQVLIISSIILLLSMTAPILLVGKNSPSREH
jgi:NADH:ubiquinone oxidoreductase subunit 6 (subunit J)